jgi:hypothetical protein
MKSFPFLQQDESRVLADGICQFASGVIFSLAKQGAIDMATFADHLEQWHEIKKDQSGGYPLSPVADELFSRICLQVRDVVLDQQRKMSGQ